MTEHLFSTDNLTEERSMNGRREVYLTLEEADADLGEVLDGLPRVAEPYEVRKAALLGLRRALAAEAKADRLKVALRAANERSFARLVRRTADLRRIVDAVNRGVEPDVDADSLSVEDITLAIGRIIAERDELLWDQAFTTAEAAGKVPKDAPAPTHANDGGSPNPPAGYDTAGVIEALGPDAATVTNEQGGKQSGLPGRCDCLPPLAVLDVARVLKHGTEKYGKDNWHKIGVDEHLDHMLHHAFAHLAGDAADNHLGHMACRALMALEIHHMNRRKGVAA